MSRIPFVAALAVLSAALSAAFMGCSANLVRVTGSGQVEREDRAVNSFEKVSFHGAGELILGQADVDELTIEADSNLMEFIQSEVRGNELVIGFKPGFDLRPSQTIKVFLNAKKLESVSLAGSGTVRAEEFTGDKLNISIAGSADAHLPSLDVQELTLSISGSGKVQSYGKAGKVSIKVAGSGEIHAKGLEAKSVKVSVAGSGDVEVWAAETLDVSVAGSGDVKYKGDAKVKQSVAGSGSVKKVD